VSTARMLEAAERELRERERLATRLRILADASHDFSEATGDYDRLLRVIARRLGEALGDLCAIRAIADDGVTLEAGAVHHSDPEIAASAHALLTRHTQRVGEGVMGRVAVTGQPLFIPRISPDEYAALTLPEYRAFTKRLDVGSVLAVPMLSHGAVIGVATLLRSGRDNPYTDSDLHLFRNIAHHAALAIANTRSHAAEKAARASAVHATEAMRQSEVAHRLLFDASPIPVLVFDLETLAILAVNDAALGLYGHLRHDLLRLTIVDLNFDDAAAVRSRISVMGDAERTGVVRHRRKDGSQFFAQFTSRVLTFAGLSSRIAVITDVTARHEAERMRALLAAIVESANDAIVSKQLDGTITSWNDAAARLFGLSAGETIGRSIDIVIPKSHLPEERALLARVRAGGRVDHYETLRQRGDGVTIPVSVSLAPVMDSAGKVVGVSKTARDLTARNTAAVTLRRTEDQLRQAQKMEAVGLLAGGIAHDFNNMLSVILSYSDLLLDELATDDAHADDIREIRSAATRAAELTRQLLLFSRQHVAEPAILDLNDVLGRMHKMLQRILGEDIDLVSAPGADVGRVLADPSNVEQIIMNLVVNARDAMPTGGKLTIETSNVELGEDYAREHHGIVAGPHVMLAVSDTGIGMDAETRARVFEPFFTTKGPGKGTGLGLSTVFGIARQCGGGVWLNSEPGRGTTFKVYFPHAQRAPDARAATVMPASGLRGSETILLVEDEEQVRAVARDILERKGYRVLVADDASHALRLAAQADVVIDLLLSDVVMPQMSGAELAKRLATLRPRVKVLCMSGYTDDSIVRHGVLESQIAYLQKPFTPESLARKVRGVLDAPAKGT